jgi:hypothetical protein
MKTMFSAKAILVLATTALLASVSTLAQASGEKTLAETGFSSQLAWANIQALFRASSSTTLALPDSHPTANRSAGNGWQ